MAKTVAASAAGQRRGAARFDIAAPVRYRAGDEDWLDATTVNIGRLGLLMHTTHLLPRDGPVLQLRVALTTAASRPGGHIACSGRVVRSQPSSGGGSLVAVTIETFHLEPHAFDAPVPEAGPGSPIPGSSSSTGGPTTH